VYCVFGVCARVGRAYVHLSLSLSLSRSFRRGLGETFARSLARSLSAPPFPFLLSFVLILHPLLLVLYHLLAPRACGFSPSLPLPLPPSPSPSRSLSPSPPACMRAGHRLGLPQVRGRCLMSPGGSDQAGRYHPMPLGVSDQSQGKVLAIQASH